MGFKRDQSTENTGKEKKNAIRLKPDKSLQRVIDNNHSFLVMLDTDR
jgi:hypothetical protein